MACRCISLPADAYPYPWIDDIEGLLAEHSDNWFDDGEELGDEYLFFLSDASEDELVALASQLASLPRVPLGAFVLVTDTQADMGTGHRIELSNGKD